MFKPALKPARVELHHDFHPNTLLMNLITHSQSTLTPVQTTAMPPSHQPDGGMSLASACATPQELIELVDRRRNLRRWAPSTSSTCNFDPNVKPFVYSGKLEEVFVDREVQEAASCIHPYVCDFQVTPATATPLLEHSQMARPSAASYSPLWPNIWQPLAFPLATPPNTPHTMIPTTFWPMQFFPPPHSYMVPRGQEFRRPSKKKLKHASSKVVRSKKFRKKLRPLDPNRPDRLHHKKSSKVSANHCMRKKSSESQHQKEE